MLPQINPLLTDNSIPRKNFYRWFYKIFATAIVACSSYDAMATENVSSLELSPEQLFSATVMSVSKKSEKLMDAPAAIYVLNNEDIMRSGATSIPEALRLVPGVQVARINTGGWAISVRGFNNALANKLLVLIDGREVYNALFSGVYWAVQDTVLEDIERIEVIRGPGATLWGSNAVNGVINIITKKAVDTQGGLVSAATGNQERALTSVRYGGALKDNGHYRIYGKYLNRSEQDDLSGNPGNGEWKAYRSGFRADWGKNTDDNTFTFQGDSYFDGAGSLAPIPLLVPPYAAIEQETIISRGGNLLGRWEHSLADSSRLTVQSYFDYTGRDQQLLNDQRASLDLDSQYELARNGAHEVTVGARYRLTVDDITGATNVTVHESNRTDNLFSGFVQDKITLVPEKWFLTLGTKLEHNDYSGIELQPNARLQWHINNQQMLWSSVARAVRSPSRLEHDLDIQLATIPPIPPALPFPIAVELQGNHDLDSEELIAYEVGYRHQLTPALLVDVSTFYNDYNKLATNSLLAPSVVSNGIDPTYLLLPVSPTNSTTGKAYGFETVINWRARPDLNFSTAYSLLEIQLNGPPASIAINSERAEGESPRHQFNLRALWDITPDIAFDNTAYYVSSLPFHDVDHYWRFDTRLGWKLNKQLQLDLIGQNLLDDSHREFSEPTDLNAAEIGRSVYGKFTWRF